MPNSLLALSHYTTVNALGDGLSASLQALQEGRTGLSPCDFEEFVLDTWIGRVKGLESDPLTGSMQKFDCRNNRLARRGLESDAFKSAVDQAKANYGADRIGVFIGTSTSGILQTEHAYARRANNNELPADFDFFHTHNTFSIADFCQQYLGLNGPISAVSTACSSSAKVFAVAYRHIKMGLCDAAIVGGVDSLCGTTLYGFNSLGLVSPDKCRPWGADRNGINIGEAAGFALLEKPENAPDSIQLLGYGESSDAYHMSTPHPQGEGAIQAMQAALDRARIKPEDVDYINLHGTATQSNDSSEDHAVSKLFGHSTPCSSTKGWTGHTLGAAGITEAIFSCLCIENNFMPTSLNTEDKDSELNANVLMKKNESPVNTVISNSFGFGGTNCSLAIGRRT